MFANTATEEGGGIVIKEGSSLLSSRCHFKNNKARRGGGITVWANESMRNVAQIQDSTLANNRASKYGGMIFMCSLDLFLYFV